MIAHPFATRAPVLLLLGALAIWAEADVRTFTRDVELSIRVGKEEHTITQKRWYLENDLVRLAVIDDPGGAVVAFVDKQTGTDHVAGQVYRAVVDGETQEKIGWGWKNTITDHPHDPVAKWMHSQPFRVAFADEPDGAKSIVVTGETAEQRLERRHTLTPATAELAIHNKLTNITDHPRRLWIRWHPYLFASADRYGDAGCVLSPGEGNDVRKIRIGWGFDHTFRTYESYWLAADFRTGEGLFTTVEKQKTPVQFTWTSHGKRDETKGALTMEPFPEATVGAPGESIELAVTYLPFSADTPVEEFPMGLIVDEAEAGRARAFLRRVKPVSNLQLLNRYTFARTIQFDWHHRRRDLLGLRDWGFADCAVVGFPYQELPLRVRMVGGVFDSALDIEKFPTREAPLAFKITAVNSDGQQVYSGQQRFELSAGVSGDNYFDREVPIPMDDAPDGRYTLRVDAIDPVTRKPFHRHETSVEMVAGRVEGARTRLSAELAQRPGVRPFVEALSRKAAILKDGSTAIPIGVEDGSGTARERFPVRLGVPFPRGVFRPDTPRRLLAPSGGTVPAQFATMNVWPDGSLKWLGVDFGADCPADGFAFYRLELGAGVPAADAPPELASVSDTVIELNTGPLRIRIPRDRLSIPGEVFVDRDGNGVFDDAEQVMQPSQPGDAWWESDAGVRYTMQLAGENSGGFTPGVELERNGSESAVVKITGWYLDGAGRHVALGEARIEVFRGKAFFKLWHQVTFTGSPWHDRLASYGITLRVPSGGEARRVSVDLDGQNISSASRLNLYQSACDLAVAASGKAVIKKGSRSDGALSLSGDGPDLLVYHRNLWQMYPKKLEADIAAGTVGIHYWPREAGVHDFSPPEEFWIPSSSSGEACGTGASRTQEIVIDCSGAVPPARARAVYGEPVIACTPPAWVQRSGVLGNLSAFDPDRYPALEDVVSETIDHYQRNREFFKWFGHWDYGTLHNIYQAPIYRWLTVGRYANIGNEEDIVQAPWLLYFRSGDRKYFTFATLWTRHLMETQSIRWHGVFPEWTGMSRRHHYTPWLGGGNWGHTMLDPWLEYFHAAGYEPAWDMAKRTATAMQNTFEGSTWRYLSNPLIGNTRMYLETGDPVYRNAADRMWRDLCAPDRGRWWVGSHGSRMVFWYAPENEACMRLWKEWATTGKPAGKKLGREFQTLDAMGALGDLIGDERSAFECMLKFDGACRAGRYGQVRGIHPVFRGMPFSITQDAIGNLRQCVYAGEQIAKARERFPARFYRGEAREIVVSDAEDQRFSLLMDTASAGTLALTGPEGNPAALEREDIFIAGKRSLVRLTVPKDGKSGLYRMKTWKFGYLDCSLKTIAVVTDGEIDFRSDEPLYVRPADLGGTSVRVLMKGRLATSLEVLTLDGERVFSRTYVRPAHESAAREHRFDVPAVDLLQLGDKVSVEFPDLERLPLYLNPDGVFDL